MTSHQQAGGAPSDPGAVVFVLFGATGDLARRMVLPAFYQLAVRGCCPGSGGWWATAVAMWPTRASVRVPRCAHRVRSQARAKRMGGLRRAGVFRRRRVQRRQPRQPARRCSARPAGR